jgi:hypothetical protein
VDLSNDDPATFPRFLVYNSALSNTLDFSIFLPGDSEPELASCNLELALEVTSFHSSISTSSDPDSLSDQQV